MKEDLLKIINHYGVMPQLKYFQSEVFELSEAIFEFHNAVDYIPKDVRAIEVNEKYFTIPEYEEHLKQHIAEEIADVMVMLKQFQYYYGIKDKEIKEVMNYKIERQLKRIEDGK